MPGALTVIAFKELVMAMHLHFFSLLTEKVSFKLRLVRLSIVFIKLICCKP